MKDQDWVIAPGETLREWREENGLGVEVTAIACFLDEEALRRIEAGEQPITIEIAGRLALGTGIKGRFWLALERVYRDGLDEIKAYAPPTPTPVTVGEIKALADEAQAGYDVEALIARRAANEHDTTATPSTMRTEGPSADESAAKGDTNTTDQPPDTQNH